MSKEEFEEPQENEEFDKKTEECYSLLEGIGLQDAFDKIDIESIEHANGIIRLFKGEENKEILQKIKEYITDTSRTEIENQKRRNNAMLFFSSNAIKCWEEYYNSQKQGLKTFYPQFKDLEDLDGEVIKLLLSDAAMKFYAANAEGKKGSPTLSDLLKIDVEILRLLLNKDFVESYTKSLTYIGNQEQNSNLPKFQALYELTSYLMQGVCPSMVIYRPEPKTLVDLRVEFYYTTEIISSLMSSIASLNGYKCYINQQSNHYPSFKYFKQIIQNFVENTKLRKFIALEDQKNLDPNREDQYQSALHEYAAGLEKIASLLKGLLSDNAIKCYQANAEGKKGYPTLNDYLNKLGSNIELYLTEAAMKCWEENSKGNTIYPSFNDINSLPEYLRGIFLHPRDGKCINSLYESNPEQKPDLPSFSQIKDLLTSITSEEFGFSELRSGGVLGILSAYFKQNEDKSTCVSFKDCKDFIIKSVNFQEFKDLLSNKDLNNEQKSEIYTNHFNRLRKVSTLLRELLGHNLTKPWYKSEAIDKEGFLSWKFLFSKDLDSIEFLLSSAVIKSCEITALDPDKAKFYPTLQDCEKIPVEIRKALVSDDSIECFESRSKGNENFPSYKDLCEVKDPELEKITDKKEKEKKYSEFIMLLTCKDVNKLYSENLCSFEQLKSLGLDKLTAIGKREVVSPKGPWDYTKTYKPSIIDYIIQKECNIQDVLDAKDIKALKNRIAEQIKVKENQKLSLESLKKTKIEIESRDDFLKESKELVKNDEMKKLMGQEEGMTQDDLDIDYFLDYSFSVNASSGLQSDIPDRLLNYLRNKAQNRQENKGFFYWISSIQPNNKPKDVNLDQLLHKLNGDVDKLVSDKKYKNKNDMLTLSKAEMELLIKYKTSSLSQKFALFKPIVLEKPEDLGKELGKLEAQYDLKHFIYNQEAKDENGSIEAHSFGICIQKFGKIAELDRLRIFGQASEEYKIFILEPKDKSKKLGSHLIIQDLKKSLGNNAKIEVFYCSADIDIEQHNYSSFILNSLAELSKYDMDKYLGNLISADGKNLPEGYNTLGSSKVKEVEFASLPGKIALMSGSNVKVEENLKRAEDLGRLKKGLRGKIIDRLKTKLDNKNRNIVEKRNKRRAEGFVKKLKNREEKEITANLINQAKAEIISVFDTKGAYISIEFVNLNINLIKEKDKYKSNEKVVKFIDDVAQEIQNKYQAEKNISKNISLKRIKSIHFLSSFMVLLGVISLISKSTNLNDKIKFLKLFPIVFGIAISLGAEYYKKQVVLSNEFSKEFIGDCKKMVEEKDKFSKPIMIGGM